jgi:hypothetical protein
MHRILQVVTATGVKMFNYIEKNIYMHRVALPFSCSNPLESLHSFKYRFSAKELAQLHKSPEWK